MNKVDKNKIHDAIFEALELEMADRRPFLGQVFEDQEELLLEALRFLDGCEYEGYDSLDLEIGTKIQNFEIIRKLGQGGMGTVYLVEEQSDVKRKVALKIIQKGIITEEYLARFEQERQALASFQHPNIAGVFGASTTEDRRPFFTMEYVDGDDILTYCNNRKLSVQDRLTLFKQACDAIIHAHLKGIIHRDIKPSNILVTEIEGSPVVKVIDFGIAKVLTSKIIDRSYATRLSDFIGSPKYMSPEQASESMEVDTRTDVYSLGVLLYELLTNLHPIQFKSNHMGLQEMREVIQKQEPMKISKRIAASHESLHAISRMRGATPENLIKELQGDLESITLQALEKDSDRRYQSVRELNEEIDRFLKNEPVLAVPPSFTYKAVKYYQRNKLPTLLALSTSAAIVIAMSTTLYGFWAIKTEKEKLERLARINRKAITKDDKSFNAYMNLVFEEENEDMLDISVVPFIQESSMLDEDQKKFFIEALSSSSLNLKKLAFDNFGTAVIIEDDERASEYMKIYKVLDKQWAAAKLISEESCKRYEELIFVNPGEAVKNLKRSLESEEEVLPMQIKLLLNSYIRYLNTCVYFNGDELNDYKPYEARAKMLIELLKKNTNVPNTKDQVSFRSESELFFSISKLATKRKNKKESLAHVEKGLEKAFNHIQHSNNKEKESELQYFLAAHTLYAAIHLVNGEIYNANVAIAYSANIPLPVSKLVATLWMSHLHCFEQNYMEAMKGYSFLLEKDLDEPIRASIEQLENLGAPKSVTIKIRELTDLK